MEDNNSSIVVGSTKILTLKIQDTPLEDQSLKTQLLEVAERRARFRQIQVFAKDNPIKKDSTFYEITGNSLFDAFYAAYCLHGDVMISANDIWLAVSHKFCKEINKSPEKYRDLFVTHQEKIMLTIELDTNTNDWDNFPCKENNWESLIEKFSQEIKWNTKGDVSQIMQNDFSTTCSLQKAAANVCLMSSMKEFLGYCGVMGCGIQNAHFVGGIEDFEYLATKIHNLNKKYPLNSYFSEYLEGVLQVVNTFLDQMRDPSKINLKFWNSIFDEKQVDERSGSGALIGKQPAFRGWITKFFGEQEINQDKVPRFFSYAPVKVVDLLKKKTYNFDFDTSMWRIEEVKPNVYRPLTEVCIELIKDDEEED